MLIDKKQTFVCLMVFNGIPMNAGAKMRTRYNRNCDSCTVKVLAKTFVDNLL